MNSYTVPYRSDPRMTPEQREESAIMAFTRNAPAWVLRKVNEDRRRAGAPEFRSGQFAQLFKHEQVRATGLGTLVGLTAYGPSIPTDCDYDRRQLVEYFAPDAFTDSVEEIKRGLRSAWLAIGHNVNEIASTADGSLNLSVHPSTGMQFWAYLNSSDEHRKVCELARAGKLGVSVGFVPLHQETRPLKNGKRYRVITKARLQHLALLDMNRAVPAYRSAVVMHTWGRDVAAVTKALHEAREAGRKAAATAARTAGAY